MQPTNVDTPLKQKASEKITSLREAHRKNMLRQQTNRVYKPSELKFSGDIVDEIERVVGEDARALVKQFADGLVGNHEYYEKIMYLMRNVFLVTDNKIVKVPLNQKEYEMSFNVSDGHATYKTNDTIYKLQQITEEQYKIIQEYGKAFTALGSFMYFNVKYDSVYEHEKKFLQPSIDQISKTLEYELFSKEDQNKNKNQEPNERKFTVSQIMKALAEPIAQALKSVN